MEKMYKVTWWSKRKIYRLAAICQLRPPARLHQPRRRTDAAARSLAACCRLPLLPFGWLSLHVLLYSIDDPLHARRRASNHSTMHATARHGRDETTDDSYFGRSIDDRWRWWSESSMQLATSSEMLIAAACFTMEYRVPDGSTWLLYTRTLFWLTQLLAKQKRSMREKEKSTDGSNRSFGPACPARKRSSREEHKRNDRAELLGIERS